MKIKRIALGLLTTLLLVTLTSKADQYGDFGYTNNGVAVTITNYTGAGGTVAVPATINGLPVASIGDRAFNAYSDFPISPGEGEIPLKASIYLTSITLPNSVTNIGRFAFSGCTNLTSIALGNGVIHIGQSAFDGCTSLTNFFIPSSLIDLEKTDTPFPGSEMYAFHRCPHLVAITVDENNPVYSSVDGVLFDKHQTILLRYPEGKGGNYVVPQGVTSIGAAAFYNDAAVPKWDWNMVPMPAVTNTNPLISITLPDSVTNIGSSAFYYCTDLTNAALGNAVVSVGDYAFFACAGLTNFLIPSSLTNIGASALNDCSRLMAISVAASNPVYSSTNGVLFNKNQTRLWQYPAGKPGSYAIPDSVTDISGRAFSGCTSLTNVILPDGIIALGNSAFADCNSLESLTIPDSVASIEYYAFVACTNLTHIIIPSGVTNIGWCAFRYCSRLADVQIHSGIVGIGDAAFDNCSSLTNVTLSGNVSTLGGWAFASCAKLASVTFLGVVTNIGDGAFAACNSLTNFSIPGSVAYIGNGAFSGCSNLTSIAIPDSVTQVGYDAFASCLNLASAMFGSGITNEIWFYNCPRLTNITVSVNNPVYSSLEGVLFNKSQTMIYQFPIGKAGSFTFPDTVTQVGLNAFISCLNLASATLGSGITNRIWFGNCPRLTNITVNVNNPVYSSLDGVLFNKSQTMILQYPEGKAGNYTIPDSVVWIGDQAFYNCTNLTSITIPNSVTSIGDYAFSFCNGLTSITIPSGVTNIGWTALEMPNLTNIYFMGNAPAAYWVFDSSVFPGGGSPADSKDGKTVYYLPGTTGWGMEFGGRPTVLWNPQAQTGGASFGVRTNRFGFNITGTSNLVIVVEACTNLANPVWQPVQTNTLPSSGAAYFSDPQWTNYPGRFYRLRSP